MKIFNKKRVFYLYLVGLLLLSILPINGNGTSLNNSYVLSIRFDYFIHFMILLPYSFLLNIKHQKIRNSFFLAMIFASFIEVIQYYLSYRTFSLNDLVANWIGIFLSFLLFHLVVKVIPYHLR